MECLARATHACVIHSFSKGEKRGTQCTERLKYQKVSRSENGRSFAKTIFWGKDFAKLRQMFLKFGGGLDSLRAQKGVWGMNARGALKFDKKVAPVLLSKHGFIN